MNSYPRRKHPRLKYYDYSQNGCYFVTVCTKDRKCLLSKISVGRDALIPPQLSLTYIGAAVNKYIENINSVYENVCVEAYVIMPNHIHLLLTFCDSGAEDGGLRASRPTENIGASLKTDIKYRPTLHTVIRSLKRMVTRELGHSIWQSSYYDTVVRTEAMYLDIYKYIEENPCNWENDKLYIHENR